MQIQPTTTYNLDNLASYKYDLNQNEIEQLKRLTDNDLKVLISQINVSYINSFDETWTFNINAHDMTLDIKYIDENQTEQTLTAQIF